MIRAENILSTNGTYPVRVTPYGHDGRANIDTDDYSILKVAEAIELRDQLTAVLKEIEEAQVDYVQVQFLNSGSSWKRYTYTAPKNELKLDDLVEVPTRYGPAVAKIVGFGKNYDCNILAVSARLSKTELS